MNNKQKIQFLLIKELMDKGCVEIDLPDGMKIEFGTLKEDRNGDLSPVDKYCWSIVTNSNGTIYMDSFNMGLRYIKDSGKIIAEDSTLDENGLETQIINVI